MGRPPYHAVEGLIRIAITQWQSLDGAALLDGCDLNTLTLSRFLSVVYVLLVRSMPIKERTEFDELLAEPVDEEQKRAEWGLGSQAETEQNAMFAMLGGK